MGQTIRVRWRGALACVAAACVALAVVGAAGYGAPSGSAGAAAAPDGAGRQAVSQSGAARDVGASDVSALPAAAASRIDSADDEPAGQNAASIAVMPAGSKWGAGAEYYDGEVFVALPEGSSAGQINAALAGVECMNGQTVTDSDVAQGWARLEYAEGAGIDQVIEQLEDAGVADEAQPNFVYHALGDAGTDGAEVLPAAAQADAAANLAAGGAVQVGTQLASDDRYAKENEPWMQAIGASAAWQVQKTNRAVTVAVIDTGCDVTHDDLKANVVAPRNVVADSSDVTDGNGHGTHVAGIVAAVPDNGVGTAGVSYNARIMPVKVIATGGKTSTSYLVKAYQYVMQKARSLNVRVVNMSLGGSAGYDPAVLRAIDSAYYDYDILSVFAAGNEGSDDSAVPPYYCFPCDYSEVGLGVVNVTSSSSAWSRVYREPSSNYNKGNEKTKDLSAPGTNIASTWPGEYVASTGTSMASPVVAGTAALAFAANPSLGAGEVKSLLASTAKDITGVNPETGESAKAGFDPFTGYGLVQMDAAVRGAQAESPAFISGNDAVAKGGTVVLRAPSTGGTWKWASRDSSIATVSQAGKVTGVAHGEAVICATNSTTGARLYRTVVVYEKAISGSRIVPVGASSKLTASIRPLSAVKWTSSDPSVATVGAASGKVTGVKEGVATITAALTGAPGIKVSCKVTVKTNIAKAKVALSKTSYVYDGKAKKPTVKSVRLNGKKLVAGTDYKVTYSGGRKNAGTYKVTLAGTGEYAGKVAKTFKIAKASNPLSVKAQAKAVSRASVRAGAVKVRGAIAFAKKGKGAITYAKVASGSSSRLSIAKKTGAITVRKGAPRGTYRIKVKVKAAGTKNYKPRTRTVTLRITVR